MGCPIYQVWKEMLRRCYSNRYQEKYPTYIGCSVKKEWHSFMAFREWMMKQEWQGKELDKDLLIQGNKIYSSVTCVFVGRSLNGLLSMRAAARGLYPIGVSCQRGRYKANCCDGYGQQYLGMFDSPMQAHAAWQSKKAEIIEKVAAEQTDCRVKNALMQRVSQLHDEMANGLETAKL